MVGHFDGGHFTSDGERLLLCEVDHRLGLLQRLAECFTDYRFKLPGILFVNTFLTHHDTSLC